MKKIVGKTSLIILMLCFIGTGCRKRNEPISVLEINPQSESAIIQNETNQIDFKFCLLNEEGIPATTFNAGENFTFDFSFKNNYQDTITVTSEFINSDFFRVFNSKDNIDKGKPWTGIWCEFSGIPQEFILKPFNSIQLRCPWILYENNSPDYPLCMGESKEPLLKGEYYTIIDLDFHYSINGEVKIINNLKLKINFLII